MKKQYVFILLIIILLNLMYLVLNYKYNQYKIYRYTENIRASNDLLDEKIEYAQDILKNKNTKAYKNKILKTQQWMRNPWETVISLIEEEKYNKYTRWDTTSAARVVTPQSILDKESLIESMTIYQRWVYFLFGKDTR